MNERKTDKRFLFLLYILAFVLLWEWLLPVIDLTDTEFIGVFLWFIGLSFLFALIGLKWWVSIPLKLIYLFWSLHYVFFQTIFLSKEKAILLLDDLWSNIGAIVAADWMNITNPMRTVLFFILLWMTIYLIRHWIEVRKSILLFYAMTVIFIAVLDTFSSYSADGAIFRIMVTGFLLIGLLTISRLSEKYGSKLNTAMFASFSLPLLFAVVASSAFASFMPEKGPVWADPIPYLKSVVQGDGIGMGSAVSKSGYDPDDSKLGGSFSQDDTLVFTAVVPTKQYWKIETKNTYTGKGWQQTPPHASATNLSPGSMIANSTNAANESEQLHAEISYKEQLPFLVYPYGTTNIHARTDITLRNQEENGQFWAMKDEEKFDLDSFGIDFTEQTYSLTALRETSMADYALESIDFTEYLQLPNGLPDRVLELAADLTGRDESVYEKIKSVERYFTRNGFVYDQQNVAIPKGNEDYVDQFLFDTKRGYCDNFSTSMVVLLRAADIPARWVKGFAPGESKTNGRGKREHRITNNEAHSWVEAYIPEIGWMPFEPTIGFSNPAGIEYDLETDLNDPEAPEIEERQQPESERDQVAAAAKSDDSDFGSFFKSVSDFIGKHKWIGFLGSAILLFIAWKVYSNRVKWVPQLLVRTYRNRKSDWDMYNKQYKALLKQLERFGIKRSASMTLTEYAKTVDTHFGGSQMGRLTEAYERGVYGGYTNNSDWESLQEIWEDLIIRATG